MDEIWMPVVGYENRYEISSYGRLKSLERDVVKSDCIQHRRERIKCQWPNEDGYMQCKLSRDGVNTNIGVHRLVASAFIPNPDNKPEVNHKDGNRTNNHVDNLEWVTRIENIEDCLKRGTHVSFRGMAGERNPNYGNRALSVKYANNPDLAMVQSRPGDKNGRARAVKVMLPDSSIHVSSYIGECAQWLIDNGYCSIRPESMSVNITRCATSGSSYKGMYFEFL